MSVNAQQIQPDSRVEAVVALLRGQLLRGQPLTGLALPRTGDDWAAILRFARDESVLRSVVRSIREHGIELPFIANQRMLRAERRELGESLSRLAALKQLLAALDAAGVQAIPLKGPVLVERLYGDATARPCLDLDLLVREAQWDLACVVLTAQGYAPSARREEPHKLNWHRADSLVELHTRFEDAPLLRLSMDHVWSRAQLATFHGLPILRLDPADELTALAMHAARHRFDRLSIVYELALFFEHIGFTSPEAAGPGYDSLGPSDTAVPGILLLACAMAERLMGRPITFPAIAARDDLRERVERLADEFWQEMLTQQRPDVRWRGRFRFLLELEPNRRQWLIRRSRHLQRAALRLEEADYALAGKFGMRGEMAVRLVRWLRLMLAAGRHLLGRT